MLFHIGLLLCVQLAFSTKLGPMSFHLDGLNVTTLETRADVRANGDENLCRYSDDRYMNVLFFNLHACSLCYSLMDEVFFLKGRKLEYRGYFLYDNMKNQTVLPNVTDLSSPIRETFATPESETLWVECCNAGIRCCEDMRSTPKIMTGPHCPRTWDGWGCWPDTLPRVTVKLKCPSYIYHHSEQPICKYYATKDCTENGTWYRNHLDHEWSNYTSCSQREDIMALQQMHIIAFAVSITLLFPAILIFICYKQLHVFRVLMHRNLFISIMFNAIFVIVFEAYYMGEHLTNSGVSRLEENSVICRLFYSVTKYLRLTNYLWMFCEGLYLHKLITAAFSEQKNIVKFYIIGWGLPVVPIVIWAALRQTNAEANQACWTLPFRYYEWTLHGTMLLALAVNFCLLANIVRVIFTKLRATNTSESTRFKRAVRATAVLIPLFGLHFFVIIYHPQDGSCAMMRFYRFLTYAVDGLQGAIIAVLFCYMNHEVIQLLKRSYKRRKLVRSVGSHTSNRRMISRDSRLSFSTNAVMTSDFTSLKRSSK